MNGYSKSAGPLYDSCLLNSFGMHKTSSHEAGLHSFNAVASKVDITRWVSGALLPRIISELGRSSAVI